MSIHQQISDFSSKGPTLYLVDISSFIFRAFYAIRSLSNSKGEPTNAVYGVATMMARLVEEAKPGLIAVVYDSKGPTFREEIYEDYKANRSEPPDDLVPQFERIDQLIDSFGMDSFRRAGVEADDLIATLSKKWLKKAPKNRIVVVTGDKDLMQLVNSRVRVWDTMKNRLYGESEVREKFNVEPSQVRDYLSLVGDTSDNIPGVPSIGPKSAANLLRDYHTLESVVQAAEEGQIPGKKGEVLKLHKKKAFLSRDLVTLKDDVDLSLNEDELSYEFNVSEDGIQLLKELEFHSLVERWGTQGSKDSLNSNDGSALEEDDRFEMITDVSQLDRFLREVDKKGEFTFDLETTSLNPREAEIVGIALAVNSEKGYYVPLAHTETQIKQLDKKVVLKKLRPYLEDPRIKLIGQNLKYDLSVLIAEGIEADGVGADTMVAAYVIDPSGKHNFDFLCQKYLGYQPLKYEEVCGKGKAEIGFNEVEPKLATRYAAEDALYTQKLWEVFRPMIYEEGLTEIFATIDLPLVKVLTHMEMDGVCVDLTWLEKLRKKFLKEQEKIEEQIYTYSTSDLNLNSPKQLSKLLFEELKLPPQTKTKTGYSTDAKVLEALAPLHEVPRFLLEYREISKLRGTYVEPLPKLVDSKTGRIHAGFHQTVAATGRLSSSDPNLQNIPIRTKRGQLIRGAFIPSEGNCFVSADYSQIELRILAHMSEDTNLCESFQKSEDVHARTAGEIYNIDPTDVNDAQRAVAKAINFGLMYGKTAFGLSQELHISRAEAKKMIERYFERYSKVKALLDRQIELARDKGYTETLLGRKRYLPDIHSKNHLVRANAERMAMNSPIQGTAADLIKIGMIEMHQVLESGGFRSRMLIQVHDELVLDCPKNEVDEVRDLLVKTMEGAMQLKVPLSVNSEVGDNWMEL